LLQISFVHLFNVNPDGIGVSAPLVPLSGRSGGLGRWCESEGVVGRSGGTRGLACRLFETIGFIDRFYVMQKDFATLSISCALSQ